METAIECKSKVRTVNNLYQLESLALHRKCVICPTCRPWDRPTPAAWMMNLSGRILLGLFRAGMYEYEKTDGIRLRAKKNHISKG